MNIMLYACLVALLIPHGHGFTKRLFATSDGHLSPRPASDTPPNRLAYYWEEPERPP